MKEARPEYRKFSEKLRELMAERGMRPCELAAAAFGVGLNKKTGAPTSNKRDRISNYMNGIQRPKPPQMAAVAAALGVPVGELEACFKGPPPAPAPPTVSMEQSVTDPDKVLVRINGMMPLAVAHQLLGLIIDRQKDGGGLTGP